MIDRTIAAIILAALFACAESPPARVDLRVPTNAIGADTAVEIAVWRPTAEPNAAVIFLHGVNGSQETWLDLNGPEAFETARRGYGPDFRPMLVSVRGDSLGWPDYRDGSTSWSTFLAEELPAYLQATFGGLVQASMIAYLGTSAGGSAALKLALSRPGWEGCVAVHSPAIHPASPDSLPGWARGWEGWDPLYGRPIDEELWRSSNALHLARTIDVALARNVELYVDVGVDDHLGFNVTAARLSTTLSGRGIPHEFALRAGGHGNEFTRDNLRHSLRFLMDCLARRQGDPVERAPPDE